MLVVLVALAGCLEANRAETNGSGAVDGARSGAGVDASLSGCRELGVARLVSFDHARSLLPSGYVPGEAAEFLGMATPTGGGVVLAGQLTCQGSSLEGGPQTWADLLVYVEPPAIDGVDTASPHANLYQLAELTTGPHTLALLRSHGFEATEAEVTAAFTLDGAVPAGSASVTDAEGDLLRLEVVAATPQPYDLLARFWHETGNGTAFFTHDRDPITMHLGAVAACEARPGSLHAEALGTTDCRGTASSGGVFAELSDFHSSFRFLPGVYAGSRGP